MNELSIYYVPSCAGHEAYGSEEASPQPQGADRLVEQIIPK